MIIAIHNTKGGVGSTTLAAHLCALGRDLGWKVDAVSADPTQELRRHLQPLDIRLLDPESFDREAAADDERDLLVIDVQTASSPPVSPDVWLVPVSCRLAQEHATALTDRLVGEVSWIPMMSYEVTVPAYLEGVEILPSVPYSRAIIKAASQQESVWSDTELALTPGAQALRESLTQLLSATMGSRGVFAEEPAKPTTTTSP